MLRDKGQAIPIVGHGSGHFFGVSNDLKRDPPRSVIQVY
jgi:hypothetical protein